MQRRQRYIQMVKASALNLLIKGAIVAGVVGSKPDPVPWPSARSFG
jgi:hypothetical protein